MNRGISTFAVIGVAAFTLTACGGSTEASAPASAAPSVAASSSAPTVALPPKPSGCSTEGGSSIGLKAADVSVADGSLVLTWTATKKLPTTGRVLLSAMVDNYDESGNGPGYQVGTAFTDGAASESFFFGFADGTNTELPLPDAMPGNEFTLTIPMDSLPGLDDTPGWSATLSLDGTDVSTCNP